MNRSALRFIIFLGIVSLLADVTYEGARSITGPYLSILGASGAAVGLIIGLGDWIGYGMRAVFGYLSDKTHQYWKFTFVGYVLNLLAVPLLAFVDRWEWAAVLIVLERFGKAIRTPARDAMLSYATKHTGRGWGFGLHEALDQVGAVMGPLFISLILFLKQSFQMGFAFLAIPACLSLLVLVLSRISYPRPQEMEKRASWIETKGLKTRYWLYVFAVGLVAAGYADFALIAYHFQKSAILSPIWISFVYALAMAVDGLAALIMGRIFDVRGVAALAVVTAAASFFAPLVFLGGFSAAVAGMVLWGIGMGSQESIMRAMVATLAPPHERGSAYGIMNLFYGAFWAVGGAAIGFLSDFSPLYVVAFSLLAQWAAIPLFLLVRKSSV